MRAPRRIGLIHWRGLWALYRWSMIRFARFALEALVGPVASALLFLLVFAIAIGESQRLGADVTFIQYLAPGIATFTLAHAAFENAAFPIVHDKLEGIIQDSLASPLASWEVAAGYTLAGATAGLLTGGLTMLVAWLFVPLPMTAPWALLGFAAAAALLFALVGTLAGLWADKWDQLAVVDTFMMLPLAFLSGAFFTLDSLPLLGRELIAFNPMFYVIDGVRFGALGVQQASLTLAAGIALALNVAVAIIVWRLFRAGYKIKP